MSAYALQRLGVNLKTGKPYKHWPRYPYRTGTDHTQFEVVWQARWFRLASFSQHLRNAVPEGQFLLFDNMYRKYFAPKAEVHFGSRIG